MDRIKDTKTLSLKQAIILALSGITFSLFFLELFLWAGGSMYMWLQERSNRISSKNKGAFVILCLGESTTAGGIDSWPKQLEKILNENSSRMRFCVINKGVPGIDSSYIVQNLETNLKRYRPDMVISMMGLNDESIKYYDDTVKIDIPFLEKLRTYRFLVLLAKNIKAKSAWGTKHRAQVSIKDSLDQARSLREGGRLDLAQKILEDAFQKNPCAYEVVRELSHLHRGQGNRKGDEDIRKRAVQLCPGSDAACTRLGNFYVEENEDSLAEDLFKRVLSRNPAYIDAYISLADLYYENGDFSRAEDTYKVAMAKVPNSDELCLEFANFYAKEDSFLKAQKLYQQTQALNPQNPEAYYMLGSLLTKQKDFSQAQRYFDKALALDPHDKDVYVELGKFYLATGDTERAAQMYHKAAALPQGDFDELTLDRLMIMYVQHDKKEPLEELLQKDKNKMNYYASQVNSVKTIRNYRKLKEALDRRGVALVCMQYPMRSVSPLQQIFKDDPDVLFIDNENIFRGKPIRERFSEYFEDLFAGDFGHCTRKGNRVIAKNAAALLQKEYFNKGDQR